VKNRADNKRKTRHPSC